MNLLDDKKYIYMVYWWDVANVLSQINIIYFDSRFCISLCILLNSDIWKAYQITNYCFFLKQALLIEQDLLAEWVPLILL